QRKSGAGWRYPDGANYTPALPRWKTSGLFGQGRYLDLRSGTLPEFAPDVERPTKPLPALDAGWQAFDLRRRDQPQALVGRRRRRWATGGTPGRGFGDRAGIDIFRRAYTGVSAVAQCIQRKRRGYLGGGAGHVRSRPPKTRANASSDRRRGDLNRTCILARWTLDRVLLERIGYVSGLCAAVPGYQRRPVADFDGRRSISALVARRPGVVLPGAR